MSNPLLDSGYQLIFRACRRIRPELRDFLYAAGLAVSPSIAISDEETRQRQPMLRSTLKLMPLVMIFSLGFNMLFSGLEGRLAWDRDPATINFFEDTWNIALYLIICPLYVALSLQIIMISSRYGRTTASGGKTARLESLRSPMALILAISLAVIFAANYVVDVAVGPEGTLYWFNDRIGGVRTLNGAGIYYSVMTFAFLFVTLLALLNYISITQSSVLLAKTVTAEECRDFAAMQKSFLRFNQAFVLARWLIATFMIHTVIWSRSPLAKTENIHIAGGLLVLTAFVLTAIPAHYLEKKVAAAAAQCGVDPAEMGIMPPGAKKWLPVTDWVIGLGFISTLWGLDPFTWLFGERRL